MMRPMVLHRLRKGSYTDQYGFEHDCYFVLETIEITRTDEYYAYEYYGDTVKNWYWKSEDGRRWMCHTPTDFGCAASWTRRDPAGDRIRNEYWIRDDRKEDKKGQPHYHYSVPMVML